MTAFGELETIAEVVTVVEERCDAVWFGKSLMFRRNISPPSSRWKSTPRNQQNQISYGKSLSSH
jgi:hypothetical protein